MTKDDLLNTALRWDKEIERNNVPGMSAFMHDDWVIIGTEGGITSKKVFIDTIFSGDLVHTKMSTEESHVRLYGTTGVVVGKGYSEGTYNGQRFSLYEWSTSVFVLVGYEWKCVLTMLTPA
jgi:hypothetical protein